MCIRDSTQCLPCLLQFVDITVVNATFTSFGTGTRVTAVAVVTAKHDVGCRSVTAVIIATIATVVNAASSVADFTFVTTVIIVATVNNCCHGLLPQLLFLLPGEPR